MELDFFIVVALTGILAAYLHLVMGQWAKELTGGWGVDSVIDALGPGAPASTMLDAFQALRRGGRAIDIGGMSETLPLNVHWLMDNQIQLIGSNWFSPQEGQEMVDLAEAGLLDLSIFEHHCYPLAQVNEAISGLPNRIGGFSNFVINP